MLNALRHHRFNHLEAKAPRHALLLCGTPHCSTPYGIKGLITVPLVPKNSTSSDLCSTPYGIKGLITHYNEKTGLIVYVLNALRHQRFNHNRDAVADRTTEAVLNALRHQRFNHKNAVAGQRTES